jgi:hypothetical protein
LTKRSAKLIDNRFGRNDELPAAASACNAPGMARLLSMTAVIEAVPEQHLHKRATRDVYRDTVILLPSKLKWCNAG